MKVTIEQQNGEWTTRRGKTHMHSISTQAISRPAYIKLIKKNHPEYIITNDVMETPVLDQAEHPDLQSALFDAPSKEEVDKADKNTGEIIDAVVMYNSEDEIVDIIDKAAYNRPDSIEEDLIKEASDLHFEDNSDPLEVSQPININPLNIKTEEPVMKQQPEASTEAPKQEQPVKRTFVRKAVSVTVGLPVYTVGAILHTSLQSTGEAFLAAARGVRNTEAFIMEKVVQPRNKFTKEAFTRSDIKAGIDLRTQVIQGYATLPVTFLGSMFKGRKEAAINAQAQPAV